MSHEQRHVGPDDQKYFTPHGTTRLALLDTTAGACLLLASWNAVCLQVQQRHTCVPTGGTTLWEPPCGSRVFPPPNIFFEFLWTLNHLLMWTNLQPLNNSHHQRLLRSSITRDKLPFLGESWAFSPACYLNSRSLFPLRSLTSQWVLKASCGGMPQRMMALRKAFLWRVLNPKTCS